MTADISVSADNGGQGGVVMAPSPESVQPSDTLSADDHAQANVIYSTAKKNPCDVITLHADIALADVRVSYDAGARDGSMKSFASEWDPIE